MLLLRKQMQNQKTDAPAEKADAEPKTDAPAEKAE